MADFIQVFLPIFIAVDVIGIIPAFLGMTKEFSNLQRQKVVLNATITAFLVGLLFIFVGHSLFGFLGITMSDFKVAGGILLFIFAIRDLIVTNQSRRVIKDPEIGIVPIGMPLIAGPGVLTAVLILQGTHGKALTVSCYALNIFIVYICFRHSDMVLKVIGRSGATAIAKVVAIFLAAIGIMLIRSGIYEIIHSQAQIALGWFNY